MSIKDEMPVLARAEGRWRGTYTYVDPNGKLMDQHESVLNIWFPEDGEFPYMQTNDYSWEDGKTEHHEFPATYKDKQIWFTTDRLDGHAWETDENTIVLTWTYRADPSVSLYELIYLDPTGTKKMRTWQWLKDGVCFQRTLINETRES